MAAKINGLNGMPDILPDETGRWQRIEDAAREALRQYGYEEIRTPVMEEAGLFTRSIGKETDIVQKQMYSFRDRGERDIALRPEGTAPIVRAYLEHNLDKKLALCRLYYIGPMFRSERPQSGRQRQFYQIGVEDIGSASPYTDAEVISVMMKILASAGIESAQLELNSLGCRKDKKPFEQILKHALAGAKGLCEDCVRRYEKNILRVFDCKNEPCRLLLKSAPKIIDHICADCRSHFETVKAALDATGIPYRVSPYLVRGLDYYTGTVFEASHKNLGSQDTVAAGGRYNDLIEQLGGEPTPACGFAIGVERLLLAAGAAAGVGEKTIELFLALLGEEAQMAGFKILAQLRAQGVAASAAFGTKSLKAQMRLANRIKARRVLIIGEEEIKTGAAALRDMEKKQQKEIMLKDVADTHLWRTD